MVSNVVVDDTDTQYIAYGGPNDWTVLTGSSRQWESTVHSTTTYGAEAAFQFLGSGFIMYGTIPAGSGTVFVDITIDGGTPTRVTRTSGSDNVYADIFYQSPLLRTDTAHTVVFTNRGHATDTSFQFDRVDLLALDADPTPLSPPSLGITTPTTQANTPNTTNSQSQSTTSSPSLSALSSGSASSQISSLGSATSVRQTVTLTQQITSVGQSALITSTSTVIIATTGRQANDHHVLLSAGAIAGLAFGALFILATFIIGFLFIKRRRERSRGHEVLEDNELGTRQAPRSPHVPTPYPTDPQLLLIPPAKDDRSPQNSPNVIEGPTTESTTRLSIAEGVSTIHTGSVSETRLQNPTTVTHPRASNVGKGDANAPWPSPSFPPGLIAHGEGYETHRESAFDAPPAYQPQRGSAGGLRT